MELIKDSRKHCCARSRKQRHDKIINTRLSVGNIQGHVKIQLIYRNIIPIDPRCVEGYPSFTL